MNLPRALYTLQMIELDLEAKQRRLHEVKATLGETVALRSAREAMKQATSELERWKKRQQELEWEIRSLEQRIAELERDLLSGRVRNPKELGGMQANVESLHHRRRELEDRLLEAMVHVEEHTLRHHEAVTLYQRAETRWREDQARLNEEQSALQREISRLHAEREALIHRLAPDALSEYQRLRQRRNGYAVSEVRHGACRICGVTLPTSLVQAVRQREELIYCSSCGRILCALD
ncbi:MAG: C4-type zinc ribbon domain-containing protein [Anaerolineae bacterium]|nr:C4-type zinc ribbon domain-containing protein [Anaerolineae bacterium]MDW8099319.1 C4-type zinc ribbon domain-containing protein [Anaerolineae bacterium]